MSCSVFSRAKSGTCANLESGNRSILGGYDSVITGDKESLTDAELKRRRRAEGDFPNSSWMDVLELPKGKDFCGVNLKNCGMAEALDESVGKVGGNRKVATAFQNVHRGVRSVPAVSFPGGVLTGHRRHRCHGLFRGGSWLARRL